MGVTSEDCDCPDGSFYNENDYRCLEYAACPGIADGFQQLRLTRRSDMEVVIRNVSDNLLLSKSYEDFLQRIADLTSTSSISGVVEGTEQEIMFNRLNGAPDSSWLYQTVGNRVVSVLNENRRDITNLLEAINNRRVAPRCGENRRCRLMTIWQRNRRSLTRFISKIIGDFTSEVPEVLEALQERADSRHCRGNECPTINFILERRSAIQRVFEQVNTWRSTISTVIVDLFISANNDVLQTAN